MSFQTALSGLTAAQGNLSVTGHNIANSSTTGFKRSRAEFADVYSVSFAGVANTTPGAGVRMADIAQQFNQGNVEFTDNNLDLAITGDGFFVVSDRGDQLYTRAGSFRVDRDGYVVNPHGQRLQAYAVNVNGVVINYTPQDLQLNLGASPASATTRMDVNVNLDASEGALGALPPGDNIDPTDPATYTYSTGTTIYDSLGSAHDATLYFRKVADGQWDVQMRFTNPVGGMSDMYPDGNPVRIEFDQGGGLITTADQNFLDGGVYDPGTGAVTFDNFLVNFAGSTQFGIDSTINNIVQDGYTTGTLTRVSVDSKGVVFASYTNGQTENVGAVALAKFNNPQALQKVGDTNWAATNEAGDIQRGQAGTGTFGEMQGGALEASNVDISAELVNMIIAQRDFQANAKMISTEDQVTQTIINIR